MKFIIVTHHGTATAVRGRTVGYCHRCLFERLCARFEPKMSTEKTP